VGIRNRGPPTVPQTNQAVPSQVQTTRNQSRYQPARTEKPVESESCHVIAADRCPVDGQSIESARPGAAYCEKAPISAWSVAGQLHRFPDRYHTTNVRVPRVAWRDVDAGIIPLSLTVTERCRA